VGAHARRVQPFRAARRLFGEDSIVGVSLREPLDDQLMRSAIARGAERVASEPAPFARPARRLRRRAPASWATRLAVR
jgi:hypothetical protein